MVTLRPLRAYVGSMRDHYANPRSLRIQVHLAQAVVAMGDVASSRMAIDAPLAPVEIDGLWPSGDGLTVPLDRALPNLLGTDTVVLIYPDALGLGFGRLESRLVAAGAKNIVVVNGRRRLFPLTTAARRALRWRRVLASTRLPEIAASIGLIPLAAVLAGYDRLWGRI
jgi:hypothetical protein